MSSKLRFLLRLSHELRGFRHSPIREAHLPYANFRKAILSGSFFTLCDVEFADFRDADLEGVHFIDAVVRRADFRGANVRGARFSGDSFDFKSDREELRQRGAIVE